MYVESKKKNRLSRQIAVKHMHSLPVWLDNNVHVSRPLHVVIGAQRCLESCLAANGALSGVVFPYDVERESMCARFAAFSCSSWMDSMLSSVLPLLAIPFSATSRTHVGQREASEDSLLYGPSAEALARVVTQCATECSDCLSATHC